MATTLIAVDCKLFQMMPYIIILKVTNFYQPTANRFSTTRKKPAGLNRVQFKDEPNWANDILHLHKTYNLPLNQ